MQAPLLRRALRGALQPQRRHHTSCDETRFRERERELEAAQERAEREHVEAGARAAAAEAAAPPPPPEGRRRRGAGGRPMNERTNSTKMAKDECLCPDNKPLIEELRKYAELQRRRGNVEVYDWYTTPAVGVLDHLRKWAAPLRSSDDAKELRLKFLPTQLKNDLKDRLDEYLLHGNIAELEEDPAITARRLFQSLPGLMHLADDFVMKGLRSTEDLLASEYAARWSPQQRREVEHYEDLRAKPRCQEAVLIGMLFKDHLHAIDGGLLFAETGCYRRRELWSKAPEIRFLTSHPAVGKDTPEAMAAYLRNTVRTLMAEVNGGADWEVWAETDLSIMIKARIPPVFYPTRWRKVVVSFVPYEEWVPQLIHHTGHDKFTERLALRAQEKGYTVTETAIYNERREVQCFHSEEDFFTALKEPFVYPWDRTEQGPQLHRRNNQFQFVDGQYKEKPRAHRVRNSRGHRPSYHELLRKKDLQQEARLLNKDFDFKTTHFEGGFNNTSFRDSANKA